MSDVLNLVTEESLTKIQCSACRKDLLFLYEKEKSGTPLYKLKVECPYCVGEHSFVKEVFGLMRSVPAPGIILLDKLEDKGLTIFKTGKTS